MKTVVFSIDVEPDVLPYSHGSSFGIQEGLPVLFDLLDDLEIKADFFLLGSILEKHPWIGAKAASGGHGIGSHGWDHELLSKKDVVHQTRDIDMATAEIERISGMRPRMFRAANFSISLTALVHLTGTGYFVDSSVIPRRLARRWRIRTVYDYRAAPHRPYHPSSESLTTEGSLPILEVPVATNLDYPGTPIGAGYINAFGADRTIRTIRDYPEDTVVLLSHPWELVDLADHVPRLPAGYVRGCSSDIKELRRVLEDSRKDLRFSTIEEVAKEWLRHRGSP